METKMNALLLVLTFIVSTPIFANTDLTDEFGEGCLQKASRISKQYFDVTDTREKIGFIVLKDDVVVATDFKSMTPGSYDQVFVSNLVIKIDRSANAYRPDKDQRVRVVFSGDFDCDNLRIKKISKLGSVE